MEVFGGDLTNGGVVRTGCLPDICILMLAIGGYELVFFLSFFLFLHLSTKFIYEILFWRSNNSKQESEKS